MTFMVLSNPGHSTFHPGTAAEEQAEPALTVADGTQRERLCWEMGAAQAWHPTRVPGCSWGIPACAWSVKVLRRTCVELESQESKTRIWGMFGRVVQPHHQRSSGLVVTNLSVRIAMLYIWVCSRKYQ